METSNSNQKKIFTISRGQEFFSDKSLLLQICLTVSFRNLGNSDLMGGKTDAVVHVRVGAKEMKTKVCLERI